MGEILNAENLKMGMNSGRWAGDLGNGLLGWDMILTLKGLRCFCKPQGLGGGRSFSLPPANSETKEARKMKLCTVIAYYITSITKELKFLNSHCSIVLAIALLCA